MRIGIDIDGVLTDMEQFILDYGTKFCSDNKKGKLVNSKTYYEVNMFSWNESIRDEFWKEYLELYAKAEKVRPFSAEVISKLKSEGNDIYIITARCDEEFLKGMEEIVKIWLAQNNIKYDKLIFSGEEKVSICKENKIDIMIEDSPKNIEDISKIIPVICFNALYNMSIKGKNIIRCYSWYDIYEKIKNGVNKNEN